MSSASRIRMRGKSARAPLYTLKLGADGKGILVDAAGDEVWTSDDEDDTDFHATFGDFIEDEQAEALIDWLFENGPDLPEDAEIETEIEYDENEDEDETDEDEDETDDEDEDDE